MEDSWEQAISQDGEDNHTQMPTDINNHATQGNGAVLGPEVPMPGVETQGGFTPSVIIEQSAPAKKMPVIVEPDPRPHLNIVFIGHVDAGKSTTCGNILFLTGLIDERTIEKYEREAKDKNRESWFLAYIMDTSEEERSKGKTVELGKAHFETQNRRFTILDAPGHKSFVPNMIAGATQADIGVLIISARKGEFETGFEKGGQTREHALLAKTLGVQSLIVAVNKMDDPTCDWNEARYTEIVDKLTPFLKACGFSPPKDLIFLPLSGLTGQNMKEHVSDPASKNYTTKAKWYKKEQPTFFQQLDCINIPDRDFENNLRIPLLEAYKDSGTMALGKIESGKARVGENCIIMPSKSKIKITAVYLEENESTYANPGENVRLKITGADEEQISRGAVLCSIESPIAVVTEFIGNVAIVEFLEHRPLITAGYWCIIHAHTAIEECQIVKLLESIDRKTKKKKSNPPYVKTMSMLTAVFQISNGICLEEFDKFSQLGRFTLRDEGKTIGIGKVSKITSTLP